MWADDISWNNFKFILDTWNILWNNVNPQNTVMGLNSVMGARGLQLLLKNKKGYKDIVFGCK
jgi:hypothetical protein